MNGRGLKKALPSKILPPSHIIPRFNSAPQPAQEMSKLTLGIPVLVSRKYDSGLNRQMATEKD